MEPVCPVTSSNTGLSMETKEVWLVLLRLLGIGSFTFLYVLGGRALKWLRRLLGSILFLSILSGISVLTKSFTFWLLVPYSLFVFSLHQGYGADSVGDKIERRFWYGIVLGVSGGLVCLICDHPILGILQFFSAVSASVILGVLNPTNAVREEALIALSSVLFMAFAV